MANENKKKFSTSLATREMQYELWLQWNTPLSKQVKKKIVTIPNIGKDSEKLNFSYIACGDIKGKTEKFFKKKKKVKHTYATHISLLPFIPFSEWMVKQTVIQPYHAIERWTIQSNKKQIKGTTDTCNNLDGSQVHTEIKKPISKDHVLYYSISVTFLKW